MALRHAVTATSSAVATNPDSASTDPGRDHGRLG